MANIIKRNPETSTLDIYIEELLFIYIFRNFGRNQYSTAIFAKE